MTLMPVSNICVFGSRSSNFGAERWIGHLSVPSGTVEPSTGSPSTL
jgi:hypothetical protein